MRSRASTGVTPRPYPFPVGFYGEQVLPRIINAMLRQRRRSAKVRDEACEGLSGDVIEIGFGSGSTLPHLRRGDGRVGGRAVRHCAASSRQKRIDGGAGTGPSRRPRRRAARRARRSVRRRASRR